VKTIIVGCGAIADRWVRVLTADPRVEVVAVVDPQLDRAKRLAARRCPQAAPAASLHQAYATHPADLVVNLTPPERHAAVSREALATGRHVITEKPLALRLRDAVELTELAHTNRLTLAVMHNRAHDPGFRTFASKIASAARGPLAVTADVVVDLRDPGFRRDQRLPVTTDLAVHAFDQVQALIAAAPAQVTAAEVALPFLGGHCGLAAITVTFVDGSVLSYRGGYAGRGLTTTAVGAWRVDGLDVAAQWEPVTTPSNEPSGSAPPPYQRCITDMLDTVRAVQAGAIPPWPTVALRSVAILDAALTAATTGRPTAVAAIPKERR
jgi:predicted dehydrogenase